MKRGFCTICLVAVYLSSVSVNGAKSNRTKKVYGRREFCGFLFKNLTTNIFLN